MVFFSSNWVQVKLSALPVADLVHDVAAGTETLGDDASSLRPGVFYSKLCQWLPALRDRAPDDIWTEDLMALLDEVMGRQIAELGDVMVEAGAFKQWLHVNPLDADPTPPHWGEKTLAMHQQDHRMLCRVIPGWNLKPHTHHSNFCATIARRAERRGAHADTRDADDAGRGPHERVAFRSMERTSCVSPRRRMCQIWCCGFETVRALG